MECQVPNMWHDIPSSQIIVLIVFKENRYTFRGDNSIKRISLPSEKGHILKGYNLLSLGANSFHLENDPFLKKFGMLKRKREVQNFNLFMPTGLSYLNFLDWSISSIKGVDYHVL